MNYWQILKILGAVLLIEALALLLPLAVSLYYGEMYEALCFLITIALIIFIALPLRALKPKDERFYAKEGMVSVGLSWMILSIVGALPFVISRTIPSYVDALFEVVSGFTTTGSSILRVVESLPKGMLFWRSFTHWLGGMGVLAFMLAIMPTLSGKTMFIYRAESTGASPGKVAPRMGYSTKVLYSIYGIFTLVEIIALCIAGMPLFDSAVHAFGTAGTGGFSNRNLSVGAYDNAAVETIITVFLLVFSVSFGVYYQLLRRQFSLIKANTELKVFFCIVAAAILICTVDLLPIYKGSLLSAFRYASFQVASIISTAGFSSIDFNRWPLFSKGVIILLMFIGACAGSTGGGIKVERLVMLAKSFKCELGKILHPRAVLGIKQGGRNMPPESVTSVLVFFFAYLLIIAVSFLIISLDDFDFETSFTAVLSAISNIGPGLGDVGPMGNFADFSVLSKLVLTLDMIIGRLEIYPVLVLFMPNFWRGGSTSWRVYAKKPEIEE